MLANPSLIVNGLDKVLLTLEQGVQGQIFDFEIPFVGKALADNPAANFSSELKRLTLDDISPAEKVAIDAIVEAFKGKEGPCLERNQAVIYKGPFKEVLDDDDHPVL